MDKPQPTNRNVLSETIMFLRFPLIVAVVFIHSHPHAVTFQGDQPVEFDSFHWYDLIRQIFSYEIGSIAVPLFFFISGFLFFYRCDFGKHIYGVKLKKRIKSLAIPYILWNAVIALIYMAANYFASDYTTGYAKPESEYNWLDWINIFWDHGTGMPIGQQFWFIRDLMVINLITPLIYLLVKWLKIWGVIALGALWLISRWGGPIGLSYVGLAFFTFGAWFSINRYDFTSWFTAARWPSLIVYLILGTVDLWLLELKLDEFGPIHKAAIIAGCVTVVSWVAHGLTGGYLRLSAFLAGSSFFVFAYHILPQIFFEKLWVIYFSPVNETMLTIGYFLIPIVVIGSGLGLFALLRKHFPAFTALINGGR